MFKNKEIKLKEDILNKTEEAFEQLYKEYSKLVFYFTYSMTGNRRDGEDLLQEVFLKVYVNINDYNPYKSSFKTWLVTITRNHVIDFLKQKKDVVYDNEFIENVIDNTIFSERIEYCIRNLNKQERDILILKSIFDFTHKEIAESLKISENVCKKTYAIAKDKTRKEWLEYEK